MKENEKNNYLRPNSDLIVTDSGCTVILNFSQTPNVEARKEIANMLLTLFEEQLISQADG